MGFGICNVITPDDCCIGAYLSQKLKLPLFDIRDIFTDTMNDILDGSSIKKVMPIIYWLERYSFKTASNLIFHICWISGHVNRLFQIRAVVYLLAIDQKISNANYYKKPDSNELHMTYAGNSERAKVCIELSLVQLRHCRSSKISYHW